MVPPDDRRRVKLRTMYCARRGRKVGVAQGEYSRLLFFQNYSRFGGSAKTRAILGRLTSQSASFLVERPCAKQLHSQQNALHVYSLMHGYLRFVFSILEGEIKNLSINHRS